MVKIVVQIVRLTLHPKDVTLRHFINFNNLLKQVLFPLLFVLIRIHLIIAKVFNFFFAHEVVLHATFKVVYLELLAALGHQLVLV